MKVVQILSSMGAEAAGPSYSVPRLAASLQQDGCDVELMSLGRSLTGEVLGVQHRQCSRDFRYCGPLGKLGMSHDMQLALSRRIANTKILHTHGLWMMPNVYPSRLAGADGPHVVLSPRGMLSPAALAYSRVVKKAFWFLYQSKAMTKVAMFHATSDQEFEDIRAAGLRQPVAILPNGIDLSDLLPPIVEAPKKILFLGRIHPIKQVECLLNAWAKVEPDFPTWSLEIRGPGDESYLAQLEQLTRSLGLARCEFGGPLYGDAKAIAYNKASLYVLPSKSENFGMTVAESLAAGTPVITTRGTPWSGLGDNDCGWWVDFGPEALAVALKEACSLSESQLRAMGENGRDWMRQDFSWTAIGCNMSAAYHWVVYGGEKPAFIRA